MARPTKLTDDVIRVAKKMAEIGATEKEISEAIGVEPVTIWRWKQDSEEFCSALKVGKEKADSRVEQSLYQRALGYSHPEDHISNYQGEVTITPTIKNYPPDTTACIFWLKNRKPEQYRANPEPDTQDAPTPVHITVQVEDARK